MSNLFLLALFLSVVGWIINLILAFRFLRNFRRTEKISNFYPSVTILMPCRGLDQNYKENFNSILSQKYPDYEAIFIVDSLKDPVYKVLKKLKNNNPTKEIKVIIQRQKGACSGKVSAQLSGLKYIRGKTKVLVFADSDFIAAPDWLEKLVAPLSLNNIKVSTGMMWYKPTKGVWSWVRALTRNLGDGLFHNIWPFIWAGSCAIDRKTFFKEKIPHIWQKAIFDDTSISQHLRNLGYKIYFTPLAKVTQRESCSFAKYTAQMTRSFAVNKIEDRQTWLLAFAIGSTPVIAWPLGAILIGFNFVIDGNFILPATLLFSVLISRILGGLIVYYLRKEKPVYIFLLPLVDLIGAYCFVKSIFLRSFTLRGKRYKI